MKQFSPLILCALIGLPAFAQAENASCQLEIAKAELSATLKKSPSAFGQLGSVDNTKMVIGVNQSVSGIKQAELIQKRAAELCVAEAFHEKLSSYFMAAQAYVQKERALAHLSQLEPLISEVEQQVRQMELELNAGGITLPDYQAAQKQLLQIRKQRIELKTRLAMSYPDFKEITLEQLEKLTQSTQKIQELDSKLEAASAWDVLVGGGVRQSSGTSSGSAAFVSVNFKYSFGKANADRKIEEIARLAALKQKQALMGPHQAYQRIQQNLNESLLLEQEEIKTLQAQLDVIAKTLGNLEGNDSKISKLLRRQLTTEKSILTAELVASQTAHAVLEKLTRKQ